MKRVTVCPSKSFHNWFFTKLFTKFVIIDQKWKSYQRSKTFFYHRLLFCIFDAFGIKKSLSAFVCLFVLPFALLGKKWTRSSGLQNEQRQRNVKHLNQSPSSEPIRRKTSRRAKRRVWTETQSSNVYERILLAFLTLLFMRNEIHSASSSFATWL